MILRGIVSVEDLECIRAVLPEHGLSEGTPSEFRTWTQESEGGTSIWVEVDVNESVLWHLLRSGFFATGKEPGPVHGIRCPHCGNGDLDAIKFVTERPQFTAYPLIRDANGEIHAEDVVEDSEDSAPSVRSWLECRKCQHRFDNPGIWL